MKIILGVSLSSSDRDYEKKIVLKGENILIKRLGTDGDFNKARKLFLDYEDKIDAFGLGGADLTLGIGNDRYRIRDISKLIKGIKTPIFDGNGIKKILDKQSIDMLKKSLDLKNKKVLMVCATNRSGMAEEFEKNQCKMTYGDLMFGLKVDFPIHSLKTGKILIKILLPIITKFPFKFIYPIGKTTKKNYKFIEYFQRADIIAGDFHYIKKYSPEDLSGKIILTTTTTKEDVIDLKNRGVKYLIVSTPEIGERCYGSNIIEAMLYSLNKKYRLRDYRELIKVLNLKPTIKKLN